MKKHQLNFIIGCLLSVFFLWLALRKVDYATLWQTLRTINYWWTIPFVIVTLVSMYARALRWHYLLLPNYRIPPKRLFSPLMIGFAFNGIFPARAGEFARAYVVARKEKMTFSAAFATVVVERVFDAATNIFTFAIALLFLPAFDPRISFIWDTRRQMSGSTILAILNVFLIVIGLGICLVAAKRKSRCFGAVLPRGSKRSGDPDPSGRDLGRLGDLRLAGLALAFALAGLFYLNVIKPIPAGATFSFGRSYLFNGEMLQHIARRTTIFIFGLLMILLIVLINRTREIMKAVCARMVFLPQTIRQRMSEILDSFARGLKSLQDIKALALIVFYSLIVWLSIGLSVLLMSYGFPQLEMTLAQSIAIVVIICIAILIPAAPGYWGLYEFGCIFALQVLSITSDKAVALGFSLVIHSLQIFPIVAIGLLYAWREHVSISKLRDEKTEAAVVEMRGP